MIGTKTNATCIFFVVVETHIMVKFGADTRGSKIVNCSDAVHLLHCDIVEWISDWVPFLHVCATMQVKACVSPPVDSPFGARTLGVSFLPLAEEVRT